MSEHTSIEGDTPRGRRYRCQPSTNAAIIDCLGAHCGDGRDAAVWAQVTEVFVVAHTPPAPWTVYDIGWREPGDSEWRWWWTILHVPRRHQAWVYQAGQSLTDRSLERIAATIVDRHLDGLH